MPMTLIEGTFQIVGAAPDGDSVRFYPHRLSDWTRIRAPHAIRTNKRGGAQLRLDGVDALETHYSAQRGGLGIRHQPLDLAHEAAAGLLEFLGFKKVQRDSSETVTSARPKSVEGYLFSRFVDVYGRCVAFAFKGTHPRASGSEVRVEVDELRKSANYHLLLEGLAYPTYYSKLFVELRRELTQAVETARQQKSGIWAQDVTQTGLVISSLEDLEESGYILPKLFRRLLDYFALGDGDTSLEGFLSYAESRDDRVLVLSEGQFTGFDDVMKVKGQKLRLTKAPEDLVFQEK
jgi:endonuclease YncB( thermonuclease family)